MPRKTSSKTSNRHATPKREPTAVEAYAKHRDDIARLLDVLQMELDTHAKKAKAEPTNWGLTGDLSNVRSGLVDLVTFMSGMDADEVEEFLTEGQNQPE
jgi:hypothetical protein